MNEDYKYFSRLLKEQIDHIKQLKAQIQKRPPLERRNIQDVCFDRGYSAGLDAAEQMMEDIRDRLWREMKLEKDLYSGE